MCCVRESDKARATSDQPYPPIITVTMAKLAALGIFCITVAVISLAHCEEWTPRSRTWLPNINYNDSRNWKGGRLPCESDRVIIQRSESLVLELPEGHTRMAQLVLPTYAELLLPRQGDVLLTGEKPSSSCRGQDAVFRPSKVMKWTDPLNWDGWNAATPDLERIPCATQSVRFPAGSTFRVQVPTTVKVGTLEVNGVVMDSADWFTFAHSEAGSRQFFTPDQEPADVTVVGEACPPSQWCECDNQYLRPAVCPQSCSVPHCREPVQPAGFCCPLCGAYFLLKINTESKNQLLENIESFLRDKGVRWHASRVMGFVQVVLVEEGEYSGELTAVAEGLRASLANKNAAWSAEEFHTSGHVWYPTTFGQVAGHFFFMFIFAALSLATIIVFMSQDWSWVTVRLSSSLENRPFVFARFENQSGEVTVAGEERRDTQVTPKLQAFDNPMYGATGQEESHVTLNDTVYTELEETSRSVEATEEILLDSTNFSE